ncbi:7329_t:CDS:2 [Racocetra fulgida]|uniref:7329_t:CDS:1 n=1 Tax=Racocetra fulgida TaxID=60492 RepID=A0A9N9H7P9_9GLOM|nr:7329_t:CDS:2 [Racocetra fulgida]
MKYIKKVWLQSQDKLKSDYVSQTKKFGGGDIIVWSCITSRSVSEICHIETHLDNKGYRIILAKDLFGTLLEYDLDLKDINQRNINILKWPLYSADLNPIENAWSEIKKCLEERLKKQEQEQETATKKEKLNKL